MAISTSVALFVALRFFLLLLGPTSHVVGIPAPQSESIVVADTSTFWMNTIQRQGMSAFNPDSTYKVFRNVMDFGAKGDGTTDDTDAINNAISSGNRCGQGCDSSTITPALVYFPQGTYLVSKPIIAYYYTSLIGDAINVPTIKASPSFVGIAVIDSDPYDNTGNNWFTNQNNFYRQVRNFVIDLTAMPTTAGAGIHWQVAQATSLQNIRFEMVQGGSNNKQLGIFMDNGSGGFMTDLTFNGGQYGAFFGNQQFTTRNMTFNNCQTAIFMNWNWLWSFRGLSINNCGIGIDMANGGASKQTVGSVLVEDSKFVNTPIGISSVYGPGTSDPVTGGTLILSNCDFSSSATAVGNPGGQVILDGNQIIGSWAQGRQYVGADTNPATGSNIQGTVTATKNPAPLLDSSGAIFSRSKPQYENLQSSVFMSSKSNGCKGDGKTDDTAALQALINKVAGSNGQSVVYIDHGSYILTSTITVPANVIIVGELWPTLMASGAKFSDPANPIPLFQVGEAGSTGFFEMSDVIFSTAGPAPGAILIEWNLHDPAGNQGASGMWDVHFRIGGAAGTQMQSSTCAKTPTVVPTVPNPACEGAFLLLHITETASAYIENTWSWVADHELDLSDHGQINIYNGRGVLIESQAGPVWLVGTASEHSTLYNYQLHSASNVYLGAIQGETAYFQSNPSALLPFTPNSAYNDPDFAECGASNTTAQVKYSFATNSSSPSNSSLTYTPLNSTSNSTGPSYPVVSPTVMRNAMTHSTSSSVYRRQSAPSAASCEKTWGLRIIGSSDIVMFGAGLYSFFDNYDQTCLNTESCQANMVDIRNSTNLALWGLSTKASTSMVSINGLGVVDQSDNTDNFCSTLALFEV